MWEGRKSWGKGLGGEEGGGAAIRLGKVKMKNKQKDLVHLFCF